MKKKFEDNVAGTEPRAKTGEPSLPWKIEEKELTGMETREGEYAALSSGEAPLATRPVFLVMLVITIFFAALYMVAIMAGENEVIKLGISAKEKEAAELQVNIDKINTEKGILEQSSEQLEKRIGDLSAQKELFTAVLESLTKKNAAEIDEETVKEPIIKSIIEPAQEPVLVSGENTANVQ